MNNLLKAYILNQQRELPDVLVENIEDITNEQWLQYRKMGIGGSDAGAVVMGTTAFSDAGKIARNKLGAPSDPVDVSKQFMFDCGHVMESALANYYSSSKNAKVFFEREMFKSKQHPYMLADCDGFALLDNGEVIGLEFKTSNPNNRKKWKSGIFGEDGICGNESYYVQVQHYMAVLGLNRYDIVITFGFSAADVVILTVFRDDEFIQEMITKEDYFWNHLEQIASQPPVEATPESAQSFINFCHQRAIVFDNQTCEQLAKNIVEAQSKISENEKLNKSLKKEVEAMKAVILTTMGDEPKAQFGTYLVNNKTYTRSNGYDTAKMRIEHPEWDIDAYKNDDTVYTRFSIKELE